jgi:type II secretory pathway pseudopilin PulG
MQASYRLRSQRGFTYLGLVILVTIIGLVGAASLKVDALLRRAAAEEELLEAGAAFSEALRSYAAATPQGQPTAPPGLQDLLRDPRFPGVRRHLRKVFVDPLTGTAEWGIVYAGEHKGVLAVYSLSDAQPFKLANFDARFQGFEDKKHLSDWKFTASGQGIVPVAITADDSPSGFSNRYGAPSPPPDLPAQEGKRHELPEAPATQEPPGLPDGPPGPVPAPENASDEQAAQEEGAAGQPTSRGA